jgi:hypothetical protein
MLVRRFSNAYTITASADDLRPGTIGLWFNTAGSATVVTKGGETITVAGGIGSLFADLPIQKVTAVAGGATLLGLIAQ